MKSPNVRRACFHAFSTHPHTLVGSRVGTRYGSVAAAVRDAAPLAHREGKIVVIVPCGRR
jgi:hypothetical protein